MAELIPQRPGEELDVDRLAPFLESLFGDRMPWEISQYASGHSNLTYLLTNPCRSVVLRRGPLGPVAPRAHDMVREYRWLQALHPVFPWAPTVYALGAGPSSVLGVPFFLMEPRFGVLVDDAWCRNHSYQPAEGRAISQIMVRRLADLHRVDWQSTGLAEMVKPTGFMRRQATGWVERYQRAKAADIPGVDALCRWLVVHAPDQPEAAVIHYDYKLDNVLFRDDLSDLNGVFDWEMATVGDPLADLAVTLSYWVEPDDPDILKQALGDRPITIQPGFYSRRDWVQAYAVASGRSIHHLSYYLTFAYFKLAVILAQIYVRYLKGQTRDARFAHFGEAVRQLLGVAMDAQSSFRGD